MWAILAVLAFAVAVVVERLIFYYHTCRVPGTRMVADIARHLNGNDMETAGQAAAGSAPVSVLLRTALERFGAGMNHSEIQEGIEEASIKELPRLSERLNYLVLFANIASGPLMRPQSPDLAFSLAARIRSASRVCWNSWSTRAA